MPTTSYVDTVLRAADKPCIVTLVPDLALSVTADVIEQGEVPDITSTDHEIAYAFDGSRVTYCETDGAYTAITYRLRFDGSASFDTLILDRHNFGGADVEITDTTPDVSFVVNDSIHVYFWDSFVTLPSGVDINVTADVAQVFRIGQIFLGRQKQLRYRDSRQNDVSPKFAAYDEYRTDKGFNRRRDALFDGLGLRVRGLALADRADALRSAYEDSNGFSDPFWWIENPATSPHTSALYAYSTIRDLRLPYALSNQQSIDLELREVGPVL